jgi:hypothetical protein
MQCAWPNTTRRTVWSFIKPSRTGGIGFRSPLSSPLFGAGSVQSFSSTPFRFQPTSPPVDKTGVKKETPASWTQLSAAQCSMAACKAVHLCFQNPIGGIEDAYLIVNSLRDSLLRNTPFQHQRLETKFGSIVEFEREVSPRLASHALLHGLLRIGHADEASSLATMMMKSAIKLRIRTLEAIFYAITPAVPPPPWIKPPRPIIPTQPHNIMHEVSRLTDLSSMTQNKSTRAAFELIDAARCFHGGRTHGMYGTLLALCLINGEIILASLLFGYLAKDWRLKKSSTVGLHEPKSLDGSSSPTKYRTNQFRYPSTWMHHILSSVNATLSSDTNDEESRVHLASDLQALAYLAVLLDHRHLPFANIAPLIRSLYNCPRVEDEVWIVNGDGILMRVKAYEYFHEVLRRLAEALPSKDGRRNSMLFGLDIESLNTLLHYALRHRLSSAYADNILQHIAKRHTHLKPDITTYNIILRSATILRDDSLLRTLESLDIPFVPNKRGQAGHHMVAEDHMLVSRGSPSAPALHPALQENHITAPILRNSLQPDSYTLCFHITHLTSTGQFQQVIDLLFQLFPELRPVHSASEGDTKERTSRSGMPIKRAVELGPYVLTALLNALLKARKTGLMKWLWRVTLKAERQSWNPDFTPKVKPWSIPIHAYTLMLHCCRLEHKVPSMIPAPVRHVPAPKNHEHMLLVGHALYRLMKSAPKRAQEVIESGRLSAMAIPQPDPPFFNAALRLFTPSTRPRNTAYYRHKFKQAQHLHLEFGMTSPQWHPMLQELGQDMTRAGYAIPLGFRHLFIGRWDGGLWNEETWSSNRPESDHRPFAYPKRPVPPCTPLHIPFCRSNRIRHPKTRPRTKRATLDTVVDM